MGASLIARLRVPKNQGAAPAQNISTLFVILSFSLMIFIYVFLDMKSLKRYKKIDSFHLKNIQDSFQRSWSKNRKIKKQKFDSLSAILSYSLLNTEKSITTIRCSVNDLASINSCLQLTAFGLTITKSIAFMHDYIPVLHPCDDKSNKNSIIQIDYFQLKIWTRKKPPHSIAKTERSMHH